MRRATLLLALFAFWGNLLQLSAQNDYIYLGNTDSNSGTGSGSEEVGGALLINASELTLLVGSQIESLCIYQNGYNPEYINAFVSEDLSGQIIGSKMITDVKKGWNTIVFDSPITIPNGDLYIGYKIKSENANIGTLTNKGSDFESFYYHTGEWHPYDLNMSVYALVGGENIPTRNVRITYCDFPNEIKNGESYPAEFSFKNLASKNVNSLQVDFSINEQVMKSWHFDNLDIAQLEEHKLAIADLQLSENGDHQAKLSITQVNGDVDQNPSDNSYHSEVYVRDQFVPRKILMEIFSTERCINCPDGHKIIHAATDSRDDVVMVEHHAGYYTDKYTLSESVEYTWFYNDISTHAPASMLDRTNLSKFGATGMGSAASPGPIFGVKSNFSDLVKKASSKAAYASLSIDSHTINDENNTLSIQISGQQELPIYDENTKLMVYLTEDSLVSQTQTGANGKDYTHNHVIRKVITSTWGDLVNLADGFSTDYTVELSDKWEKQNLNIVAFVYNHNENDPNDCRVYQADERQLFNRINSLENEYAATSALYYNRQEQQIVIDGEYRCLNVYTLSGILAHRYETASDRISTSDYAPGIYILDLQSTDDNPKRIKINVR